MMLLNFERAKVMEVHVHARARCFLWKYGTLTLIGLKTLTKKTDYTGTIKRLPNSSTENK